MGSVKSAAKMTITQNTDFDGGNNSSVISSQESILDLHCEQSPSFINAENYFDSRRNDIPYDTNQDVSNSYGGDYYVDEDPNTRLVSQDHKSCPLVSKCIQGLMTHKLQIFGTFLAFFSGLIFTINNCII